MFTKPICGGDTLSRNTCRLNKRYEIKLTVSFLIYFCFDIDIDNCFTVALGIEHGSSDIDIDPGCRSI